MRVKVSIEWKDAELRPRLANLAADQQVPCFLDRRIDPNQELDFARSAISLRELFDELATAIDADSTSIGPVIYIGPPPTAAALAEALGQRRKELGRIPSLNRARARPLRWDKLSEPRQLLLDVAREYSLSVVNPEAVPHDLWPAADFPPLSLAEQLTLLLAGFDLTFEAAADGKQMRLVPLPTSGPRDEIVRQPAGSTAAEPAGENTRYDLTVQNQPAGAVVNRVAKQLGRQLECSAAVRQKLSATIDLKVKGATLAELMDKTLSPLGLTFRLTKETLQVVEKP